MTGYVQKSILGFHFRLNKIQLHFIAKTYSWSERRNSEDLLKEVEKSLKKDPLVTLTLASVGAIGAHLPVLNNCTASPPSFLPKATETSLPSQFLLQ